MAGSDWIDWHREYDRPESSLARRLVCVRDYIQSGLAAVGDGRDDGLHIVSICAGDGRDVLPVIAEWPTVQPIAATLIELDPSLAARAREFARGLPHRVEVRQVDAGVPAAYGGLARADILLACGVFGNVSLADARTTVQFLPRLLHAGGIVIWTRGRADHGRDPSLLIRDLFRAGGFEELAFTAPTDARFRVGMSKLRRNAQLCPEAPNRIFNFAA